jgi:hypothetical protein
MLSYIPSRYNYTELYSAALASSSFVLVNELKSAVNLIFKTFFFLSFFLFMFGFVFVFQSAEEQTVLMNDGDYHGRGNWRRSRNSESGGPLGDDMETSYVPSSAYLSGHHRGRYVSSFCYLSDYLCIIPR